MLRTDAYPVAVVDDWIADGLGLGSDPRVLGVVAMSEAWRHLTDDEMLAVAPEAFDRLIVLDGQTREEAWSQAVDVYRARTRPRDLPDHLRAETRVALCVLGDGAVVQILRDRGAAETTVHAFSVTEHPDALMPRALLRLLLASEARP